MKSFNYSKTKKLFQIIFPHQEIVINSIKLSIGGYTNITYCVKCNGQKYQIKLSRPHSKGQIKAKVYFNKIMSYNDYLYVNLKKGITVRKWFEGKALPPLGLMSIKYLKKSFLEIKKIHSLGKQHFSHFKHINLKRSISHLSRLDPKYKKKYLQLIKKYSKDPVCINKVDNASNNILLLKSGKFCYIDNEWVQLANDYWDYAETLRWIHDLDWSKINFHKYIKHFSMSKLKDFIFMSCVYNYLWTYRMKGQPDVPSYRKHLAQEVAQNFEKLD